MVGKMYPVRNTCRTFDFRLKVQRLFSIGDWLTLTLNAVEADLEFFAKVLR